jgi:hypothetical protein
MSQFEPLKTRVTPTFELEHMVDETITLVLTTFGDGGVGPAAVRLKGSCAVGVKPSAAVSTVAWRPVVDSWVPVVMDGFDVTVYVTVVEPPDVDVLKVLPDRVPRSAAPSASVRSYEEPAVRVPGSVTASVSPVATVAGTSVTGVTPVKPVTLGPSVATLPVGVPVTP